MGRKINILFTSTFGSMKGGGQRSLLLLLERLDREKYQPFLVSSREGELVDRARQLGITAEVVAPPSLKNFNFVRIFKTIRQYADLLKAHKIDIIHTDSPRWTVYLGWAARGSRVPVIFHVRVSEPEPMFYERALYAVSRKIIVVSEGAKKRFQGYPKTDEKIVLVYNSVDTSEFHPGRDGKAFREELGAQDKVLVGIVGELAELKGQKEFITAAVEALKEHFDIRFVVIGDGDEKYRQDLQALVREKNAGGQIKIVGFREGMPEVMAGLDILVNASTREGFSRVIVEAMAAGKPVIATNVGGNPEAVEDGITGRLVPARDPMALAAAIRELTGDPQKRNRMGEAGRKRAEQLFDIQKNVRAIEEVYDPLVSR